MQAQTNESPTEWNDSPHLAVKGLLETLGYSGYPQWIEIDLDLPIPTVLTFEHDLLPSIQL